MRRRKRRRKQYPPAPSCWRTVEVTGNQLGRARRSLAAEVEPVDGASELERRPWDAKVGLEAGEVSKVSVRAAHTSNLLSACRL